MCPCVSTFFNLLNFKSSNYRKFIKNLSGVRSIFKLVGQVLARPVLVVLSGSPQPREGHVVNQTFVSHPNLRLVLTVAEGQLCPRDGW